MSVEPLEVVEATCLTFREVRAAVGVKYRRKRFRVYDNARGWLLGAIRWDTPLQRHVFHTHGSVILSLGQASDITNMITRLNKEVRE